MAFIGSRYVKKNEETEYVTVIAEALYEWSGPIIVFVQISSGLIIAMEKSKFESTYAIVPKGVPFK